MQFEGRYLRDLATLIIYNISIPYLYNNHIDQNVFFLNLGRQYAVVKSLPTLLAPYQFLSNEDNKHDLLFMRR